MLVLQVSDPAEQTFPFDRSVTLVDAEDSREQFAVPEEVREAYLDNRRRHFDAIREACLSAEIDIEEFACSEPLDMALHRFLHRRNDGVDRAEQTVGRCVMGLLVPLFAFGVALIGIPYFVHRIRRPERETVRFSSLMFVPDIKREVIERRRVQHVVLMLLRMAVLVALALAFARPFQEMMLDAEAAALETTDHVIAMDVSLSMGYEGVWERAKTGAKAVLETVEPGDRVGFVRFAQQAVVDVPLSGDVADVRHAIEIADVTWAHTDYVSALQAVEHVFCGRYRAGEARSACDQRFSGEWSAGVRYGMAIARRD